MSSSASGARQEKLNSGDESEHLNIDRPVSRALALAHRTQKSAAHRAGRVTHGDYPLVCTGLRTHRDGVAAWSACEATSAFPTRRSKQSALSPDPGSGG